MQMVINSIKSTVLVVFGVQHNFIDSKNILSFSNTHLHSIKLFINISGVFLILLKLVEAVDARLVRNS